MDTFLCVGGASTAAPGSQKSVQQHSNYQTPASALYESSEDARASVSLIILSIFISHYESKFRHTDTVHSYSALYRLGICGS